MTYDAITIDTQTVYANSGELETGIVGRLKQYSDGPVQVVLSEVFLREVYKLRVAKAQSVIDKHKAVLRDGRKVGILSEQVVSSLEETLEKLPSAKDHVTGELNKFVRACGAEIVRVDLVDISELMRAYFARKAPFSGKGKKNEFPDAIALLSLEKWAVENRKRILAVSGDGDWQAFAEQSGRIDVVEDLGAAMASLTAEAEKILPEALRLVASVKKGAGHPDFAAFERSLDSRVSEISPYIEFDGPMHGEAEEAFVALTGFELLPDDDDEDIEIVQIGTDQFVARVPISVKANVTAQISFAIYDSIDKDYVPMGATEVERDVDFDTLVLIHAAYLEFEGDGEERSEWQIERVELVEEAQSFDLGYVDYSLSDEYGYEP